MKKKMVLSTLLGVTLVASLAACGGQTEQPKSTAAATSATAGGAKDEADLLDG